MKFIVVLVAFFAVACAQVGVKSWIEWTADAEWTSSSPTGTAVSSTRFYYLQQSFGDQYGVSFIHGDGSTHHEYFNREENARVQECSGSCTKAAYDVFRFHYDVALGDTKKSSFDNPAKIATQCASSCHSWNIVMGGGWSGIGWFKNDQEPVRFFYQHSDKIGRYYFLKC
jgi:hypothetical protein